MTKVYWTTDSNPFLMHVTSRAPLHKLASYIWKTFQKLRKMNTPNDWITNAFVNWGFLPPPQFLAFKKTKTKTEANLVSCEPIVNLELTCNDESWCDFLAYNL